MMYKNKDIDSVIQGIEAIIKSRCSPSDEDVEHLNECLKLLQDLKKESSVKKRKIYLSRAIEILVRFFSDDIHNLLDGLN